MVTVRFWAHRYFKCVSLWCLFINPHLTHTPLKYRCLLKKKVSKLHLLTKNHLPVRCPFESSKSFFTGQLSLQQITISCILVHILWCRTVPPVGLGWVSCNVRLPHASISSIILLPRFEAGSNVLSRPQSSANDTYPKFECACNLVQCTHCNLSNSGNYCTYIKISRFIL